MVFFTFFNKQKIKFSILLFISLASIFSFAQGSGNVLSFNGVNKYIDLGSQVSDNCRTLELWFKPSTNITSSITDAISLVMRDYANGSGLNTNEFGFYFTPAGWNSLAGGSLVFYRRVGQTFYAITTNSTSWQANVWYHVAGVIDPVSGMKIYLNGVLQNSTDPTTQAIQIQTGNSTDMIAIGTWGYWGAHSGNRFFNGDIDEVRFWSDARTQTQIRDNMCRNVNPIQSGLQGYYRFDSNLSSTLPDLTGNNYNGTLVNIPSNSWHYSSAPIGDTSVNLYPVSWTAQTLSMTYSVGDIFNISNITGTPAGAHIYRVNSLPNMLTGLTNPLSSYYGVFLTGTSGNFTIGYDYSSYSSYCGAGCINYNSRNDNAVTSWTGLTPIYSNCTLSKTNESTIGVSYRGEYILATSNTIPSNILGSDTTLCSSSSYLLNVNLPGSTELWSDNSIGTSLSVSSGGIYWVDVTLNGCTRRDSINVSFLTAVTSSVSNITNASCFGGNNGSVTVSSSGGSGNYTYNWFPTGGTSATANSLSNGTYTCTITDSNGCTTTQLASITQPTAISIIVSSSSESCFGANNGSASANTTGGTGGYIYNWSPTGGSSSIANGLVAGNYSVVVTDANGCTSSQTISVTQPNPITISFSTVSASCTNSGSATANPSGGNGPYTYLWSTGGTLQTENNLFSGTYSVTVTDINGCSCVQTVVVGQIGSLTSTSTFINNSCFGDLSGSATVFPTGGTSPYSFSWSPTGGNNSTANNLSAGTYVCTITDANGCVTQQTITITQPSQLTATFSSTNILCYSDSSGSANLNPSGGIGPYTFIWNPSGGNNQSASGLSAGVYSVNITDNNGCLITQQITITQPPQLFAVMSGDSLCGGGTGIISSNVIGGVAPYTYNWSNSATGSTVFVNATQTSTYSVLITDANGCVIVGNTNVIVFPNPTSSFASNTVNGYFNLTGNSSQICFTDLSTSNIISWLWNLNGNTSTNQSPCTTVTSSDTGSFCATLIVATNHNCLDTSIQCFTIGEIGFTIPNVFTPNGDGINDNFFISNTGMKSIKCQIYDRWGVLIWEWDNTNGYWDGKSKSGKMCSDGTYYYVAELTDNLNKQTNLSGFVQLIKKD